jgi:hypothetical protein
VNVVGISSLGITTVTGVGQTALTVNGDARITGVLTVGQGSVTIGSTNITTQSINNLAYPTAGPLSNRNLIINGEMAVSQRTTSTTNVTTANYLACDRFVTNVFQLGTWTINQRTGGFGDTWEAGAYEKFRSSLELICTTADASPGGTDNVRIIQYIEGRNLQHLNYGESTAQVLTLSFWVKSNKTGTASFEINQPDNSIRMFTTSYTINAADTWEKKVINIPADTAGVINNDSGRGLMLQWWLNSGPDYTGGSHSSTWVANDNTARNATNLGVGGAGNDDFSLTGVQLEVGERATPFEHELYSQTLAKCQRYYQIITPLNRPSSTVALGAYYTTTRVFCVVDLKQTMRGEPTLVTDGDSRSFQIFRAGTNDLCNAPTFGTSQNINQVEFEFTSGVDTAGDEFPCWVRTADDVSPNTGDTAYIAAQAEL